MHDCYWLFYGPRRGETKKYTLKCTDRFLMVFLSALTSHSVHMIYYLLAACIGEEGAGKGSASSLKKN